VPAAVIEVTIAVGAGVVVVLVLVVARYVNRRRRL